LIPNRFFGLRHPYPHLSPRGSSELPGALRYRSRDCIEAV
jgi:hypothetical protein